MNGEAHTHQIEIKRRFTTSGTWQVKYGETAVRLAPFWRRNPSTRQIRRATIKAVLIHDRGTVKAVSRESEVASLQQEINAKAGKW